MWGRASRDRQPCTQTMTASRRRPVRLLPEDTVRRIAAGEVITRPAAVVKELVENSLDAGASNVRVEVRDGGKNLIRVVDDGCGMTRDDLRLAVSRYATSKIDSIDDLRTVRTYGFRGEALAAIAAVSRLTIVASVDAEQPGTELVSEGGNILELREAGRSRGTTVTCRTLFYNLPVRQAFLKSGSYELKLIVDTLRGYATVVPEVAFELIADGRTLMSLPAVSTVRERLYGLYEKRVVDGLVELKGRSQVLSFWGLFSEPTRLGDFYDVQAVFFNQRPIRNRTVVKAVYESYGPVLHGRHPDFILFLDTDPARLDVNIHPTKQDVRFADERFLVDFIMETVRQGLGIERDGGGLAAGLPSDSFVRDGELRPNNFWQLHNTYILAQVASGYVIVDQHAAHERILFETIRRGRQPNSPQGLLFPIAVELSPEELEAFKQVSDRLARMGLEAKVFSGHTVIVDSVPAGSFMGQDDIRGLLTSIARIGAAAAELELELAKLLACKGAVKAGQRLTEAEMESLINRLFACSEPYFCPHGRPAIIRIGIDELDRRFGRT